MEERERGCTIGELIGVKGRRRCAIRELIGIEERDVIRELTGREGIQLRNQLEERGCTFRALIGIEVRGGLYRSRGRHKLVILSSELCV